jgi:hypothetical protein
VATWALLPSMGRSSVSVQAASESAPGATDGCNLNDVGGFDLVLEADNGETFSGTGKLDAYRQHDAAVGWAYSPSSTIDLATLTPSIAGQRRFSVEGWTVANPRGAIAHVANGVGVSGGGITVRYYCTGLKGERV